MEVESIIHIFITVHITTFFFYDSTTMNKNHILKLFYDKFRISH